MRWFVPSWNGDVRLTPSGKDRTVLTVEEPTPDEREALKAIGAVLIEKGWCEDVTPTWVARTIEKEQLVIRAPIEEVGPVVVGLLRPGPAVLTAVRFSNGRVLTTSDGPAGMEAIAEAVREEEERKTEPETYRSQGGKKPVELAKPKAEAAATVRRPTPSCPQCIPGSVDPAREVLLAFLDEQEHEQWSKERAIIVRGGLSGHRYLLAHRHSPRAQYWGRMCFDIDEDLVVHFHDWRVPPEEEVLAAKLILEHREPWLRNEATMLGCMRANAMIFKNPFGGGMDGVPDSYFTSRIGSFLRGDPPTECCASPIPFPVLT